MGQPRPKVLLLPSRQERVSPCSSHPSVAAHHAWVPPELSLPRFWGCLSLSRPGQQTSKAVSPMPRGTGPSKGSYPTPGHRLGQSQALPASSTAAKASAQRRGHTCSALCRKSHGHQTPAWHAVPPWEGHTSPGGQTADTDDQAHRALQNPPAAAQRDINPSRVGNSHTHGLNPRSQGATLGIPWPCEAWLGEGDSHPLPREGRRPAQLSTPRAPARNPC